MKQILVLLMFILLLVACQKEDDYVYENPVSLADVKMISLRADHKTVVPDGKAKMQFYIIAYGIKEQPDYSVTYKGDTAFYQPSVACDTFIIPADMLPEGALKLFDETGKEYPDKAFTTSDAQEKEITFYAKSGELESNRLSIHVRKLPAENYEELVFPVIFHVLNPAEKVGSPTFKVTEESVKTNLERLNNVFNGLVTTDPNGGKANIRFEAAKYNPSGVKLSVEGMHQWNIGSDEVFEDIDDYAAYVKKKSGSLIYDYRHYLNIWLINYPEGSTASVNAPTVIMPGEEIPGLFATEWPVVDFPGSAKDVGFFVNMSSFLNPMTSVNFFEISNPMAKFFGLLDTEASEMNGLSNMVDGDTDYCPDTYYYWNDNQSVKKDTSRNENPGNDTEYFTSYNIMDRYSMKNSITVDQVARIRMHIEKCPSRWMYKSKFPFTGKREDWEALD